MPDLFEPEAPPEKKGKVLIVDDDPITLGMLETNLEDDFEVQTADSGEACLEAIPNFAPGLVLLDIEMPGIDGYETCRRLQEGRDGQPLPVIFVSSHDTLDERLKAYESGGMDFVIKPFEADELSIKIKKAIKLEAERRRLAQEKDSMQQMAMNFLTSLGESGTVLHFLRNCPACSDYPALAKMVMDAMQEYGSTCLVQIRVPTGTSTFTQQGPASPLEESVFGMVHGLERIFQFKSRMIVNYEHVSLLVNNLPIDNPDLCGRIRDNAAYITEGAEASAQAILQREEAEARAEQLQRVTQRTLDALENLREQYRKQQRDTRLILYSLTEKMDKTYISLGLTDGQEKTVDDAVRGSVEEALNLFERGLDFDGQFTKVLDELKKIT
jgi:CheY-like chemotaxis protein